MPVSIPGFLRTMLADQYGADTSARILDGYGKRRPVTLRANTLRAGAAYVRERLTGAGILWREVPWSPEALILEEAREPAVRSLDLYEKGEIYLQSLSSMIPPLILNPQAGECILDMAAAPGGKTTQMAALSGGRAQITACEKNYARAERLKFNLARQGATRVLVMNEDARKLDPYFSFDKILLDAPCSGSGTVSAAECEGTLEAGTVRGTERGSESWSSGQELPGGAEAGTARMPESGSGSWPFGQEPPDEAEAGTARMPESGSESWSFGQKSPGGAEAGTVRMPESGSGSWPSGQGSPGEATAGGESGESAAARNGRGKRGRKTGGRQDNAISEELIARSVRTQEALLHKALALLKPGGEMVYSTCSVLEAENEGILRRVLPGAGAEAVPIEHPMLADIPLLPVTFPGTVCVCPTELYEGFFVAKLRKF